MNVDVVRQKLVDGDTDAVLKELVDLYRRAEILHTPQLGRILEALFPVWKGLLQTKLPPQLRATMQNRCRKVLLQILNRLPSNEALRPYVAQLLQLLMEVLQKDNEDNALIALKTLFDLHRNYRPALRNEVQPFLELVQLMYKNLQATMKKQFSGPPETHKSSSTVSAGTTPTAAKTAVSSATPVAEGAKEATPSGSESASAATTEAAEAETPVPQATTSASAGEASATATETTADSTKAATETTTANTATAPSGDSATDEPICSNLESFKTISELPLIIMLLFQCYPSYIESYIPVLVPLMMSALALRAPDTAATTHPSRYLDFLDCQVKTLSFVTYLLRGCANLMRPFQDAICENTVKLLIACPKDAFVLRKDIFVAARHIISTDFRRGFYPQLELLMNDDVLIGKGRCSFYQIRPLAYSTLADMIHHVRDMLTLTQVSAIVDFYGKRIHDPTLPISIQTTSIRLLLNLVDISAKNEDADAWKGRNILSRILLIISGKFGTTLANLPVALATTLRNKSASDRSDLLEGGAMDKIKQSSLLPKEVVQKTQYERKLEALLLPYMRVQRPADSISEEEPSIRDIKSLLRTMILGIRAVIWCTANYRNPLAKDLSTVDANTADASGIVSVSTSQGIRSVHSVDVGGVSGRASGSGSEHVYPLTDDERLLIAKVLRNGLRCFILYTLSDNTLSEEKQMLDHFAGAFTVLEAADFRDLFISNIELLYECILQDHAILTIPQHFLANSNVSCWFAEILLKFLITQMKDLSVEAEGDLPDTKRVDKVMAIEILQFEKMRPVPQVDRASIVLRLFKIVFGSVTLFKSNESALFPHLRTIIESCLKQATFTKHPDNYLLLLRALFRSISGGKYENFYKEVFPLLPGVLSALMRLQKHIGKPAMQEVLLELCLTIPARLSSLLQYLPSLMKSVVRAILSRGELAYLGLRTLEFWVDNLNPDFLYPIMTSQDRLLTEIIEALNTHLIPPPYPYGELAMRILGKIGGRNRQYLMDPLNLDYHEHSFTGLTFTFQWGEEGDSMNINMKGDGVALAPSGIFPMKMDVLVAQATKVLRAYLRNTSTDRNNVSKTDSRLADVDEFEEGENLAGPAFLLEKDDKTLHLETETMAKIRGSILQHKRCAFMFVSRAAVVSLNVNYFANADLVETDRGDVAAQNVEPMRKIMSQEALRVTRLQLLQVLFETVVDVDVGMEAKKVLDGIAGHLTVLTLANCSRDQPDFAVLSSLHASTLYAATRGLSPGRHLATTKRIETLRQAAYGTSNMMEADVTNDFYSYVQAVSVALSSPDQQVVDAAKEVTTLIIKTAIDRFDSPRLAVERGGALFNCMCEVFSHGCYDKGSWRQKLGGAIGLQLLVDLLEPQWCHENELTIIKALFFVLSDHPPEVSATVSAETGEAMVNVVKTGWKVRSGYAEQLGDDDSKKKDFMSCVAFQDTEVFQMLVVEFLSPKAPTRQYAKQCINTIASLQESTASALLYPYNQLISKQITGCNLRMLPSNTRTGYVDAMAYALSLKPPIFSLTKEIMVFLQEVWKLISEDSQRDGVAMVGAESPSNAGGATAGIPGSGVSAQEYPFGLSQACELRIAAAKLLRAAFLAAPNDLNQHPEYRNRFVGVFFRYLTGQPPELVQVAQDALTDVIQLNKQNKDVFLPKELLQQCLRPVLLNLADYRKLNLPLLEGLSRLLTLLSSCFNVTLGEKLLEHLKQWRDPDRIIKAGIWKRGEEPAVAAAIVDLFHLLPPNDAFLEPLINCVVDLEAVLPKYGSYGKMSSPYRIPLTRFLNRYASMTVSFFLKREHLVEVKYSSLFQQLIKVPEAAPLHAVIIGDGGAESVVEATFNAALKINASEVKGGVDVSSDAKMQAQIQLNAQKAAAQAVATAQAQGMTASAAEARGVQARAAYVVKAQAQVNAQQALKVQSQVQIQANAQKLHAQTLAAAQAQGLSLVQAQAKAQFASKDYIAKAQSHISSAAMQASLPNPAMSSLAQQEALELHYQGLRLVRSISKLHPTWLASQTVIIDALRKLWRSSARVQRLVAQDRLPIKFHLESKLLIKCMITYSRAKPEDVQVLLDMVSVFLHRTPFDFSFLQTFYREEVAAKYTAANKRNLIRLFLRMLREPGASEELKVHAVQLLIMPVLTASFEDPGVDNIDVMDLDTVMWMLREILASKEYSPDAMQSLRIELLKLGTLLIQHMSKYVTDHRKEVIKFAWNHLKAHDLTSKLWAYVNVCRFISVYDTPPKIVLQVYVALLRTHEMDARFLVRKAFDILLPALPSRLPSNEFIKAIKWTKKIAYEEGHVLGQLVHIWFLIVRHPALFYPFRGQFVPLMVNSLNRLAIPPSSTPDNRRLAVNIVDLVISWEQTRQDRMAIRGASSTPKASTPRGDLKRSPSAMITASEKSPDDHAVKKRKVLTTGGTDTAEATVVNTQLSTKTEGSTSLQIQVPTQTSSSGSGQQQGQTAASPSSEANRVASNEDDFELSGAMVDLVINFAFRFALASADKQDTSRLAKTCGELFDKALRLWPSASIRFSYFDKLIAVTAETVIRQQQQVQASMNAAAAAAGGTGQQVPIPAPPPPTVMPPFFVVPKGAPLSSLAILDAVLGILNSLITPEVVTKSKRPVPYVIQYAPRIMKLLEPCFDRQNHEIQASLTKFLRRMTELYPPSRAPQPLVVCKFYPWLREIINERLVSAAIFQQELGAGGVALSGGPGAAGSKAKGKTAAQNASGSKPDKQGAAGSNAAAGHAHAGKHQKDPSGINPLINHEAARMRLLISQHPRAVVSPSSYPGEKATSKKKSSANDSLGSDSSNSKAGNAMKKKMGVSANQVSARSGFVGGNGKRPIELLVLCYALLAKCTFTAAEHRRLYTNLLVHCLEGSYNIPLLLQITRIVAKMIASTDPCHQVLSAKDKMTLLSKMATFDRLNEISALPLNEEYYQLVLKLCEPPTEDSKQQAPQLHLSPTPQSHSLTTHFMAGLLAPDPKTREKFLQIFFAVTGPGPVARLQLVLRQDWQACGTRYWPVIAIETLMAAISPNALLSVTTMLTSENTTPKTPAHGEFLETYGQIKASELTLALRDLAHIDLELAKELWVSLFSAVWGLLQETDQSQVSGQLLKILASKYNKRDLNVPLGASTPRRTNVVQTLMKGIVSTSPSAPVMTPELVLHIASAYDVWSCAIRLCEFQVEKSDLSVESRLRWIEALSAIYKQLSEDDLRIGLSIENIAQPETRTALTLEALGCVHEAQEEYFHALSNAQSGRVSVEDVNLFELRLWEERWNQELLLDCAWKRGDWASAKQLLLSPSMQSSAELGCPQTRLQRLYISILDADKRSAIDTLASQTAELALHQWQGLPRILSRAHLPLMHLFHKFVEVKESIQMMEDIKSASAQHAALPNLKPSINTWRERLPNKWEPILLWDDILTWRSHMFQVVKTTFAWSDAQVLACMHDSPWSVIKLAHTARKQRLPDVCLGALAKLYSVPAMDVQDAFSKLREQVSICYESATEYSGGLSILNTTNLDYFSLRQKAEMFRLKALFLEAQGSLPEANKTFSHCLQICDSYGKGWLSWGHYCYRLFLVRKDLALASQTIACYLQAIHHRCNSARLMIARVLWLLNMDDRRGVLIQAFETHGKQLPIWIWIIWIPQLLMALGRPEAPQIRGLLRGLSAKFPQALYYTMRAFFLENRDNAMLANQRLASGVSPSASASSPAGSRTYYRTKSGHVVGVPITMPVAQVEEVPGLVGPPRPTPAAFNASPSVVLTLEAWTEKVRNNGGDGHSLKAEVGPVQYTEDLLNFLRRSHDSLTFEMECMLEEMITRFRPEPEEELLTAVHALLLKCYQLPRLTKTESVPKMLRAALARVCRKLFVLQPHQKNEKHEAFVEEFKAAFERDFTPLEDDDAQHVGAATTLYEIMNRLKRWKSLLQLHVKKVGKRNAGKLYLEQCSRHLMELSSSNMEVPGQYVSDSEPIKDLHARIQHFKSTVGVLLRNGFTQRRVAMGGSDGRTYYFLVQYAMTHITRTDERMMQMYLLLNRLLLRHKETKKRNTVFHVPKVIPLTPRVRLLEDNRDFVTLGEIYELDCQIENKDPDLPVELYRERVSDAYAAAGAGNDSGKQEEERVGQAKAHAFQEICNEHVPETLLAKYVHGISAHSDAYFQFRSEFTKHLALSSFLSYALFVGDRAPHRVLFSRRTGRVVSTELRPGYASSGILEAATTMPFRLTRNLHNFMTRPGVQGPFSVGMTAAAEALTSEEDVLSNQLCLFFRDDLLSWHASKTRLLSLDPQGTGRTSSPGGSSGPASPAQRRVESQVQQRVEANVSLVLERIRGVSLKKDNVESSRGRSVQELLEIATSPERQQEMYPTWSPWL
ncbi:Phosphatidylinositol kinase (PIK-L3) [Phytophthora nicotianae]|uniref:Phosphatidylinositol kinase (PIK-L3) n=1 Tax=Phytophthora nicotianae TaxID=4792 RepID=A0A0W8BVL6_PHYNI|nr:Phosphatidylinositol kinase (PIK-L3) [Phytophthora nicotianae]